VPSASDETLSNWKRYVPNENCHGELMGAALLCLETNFKEQRGYFTERVSDYKMTDKELAALCYLAEEWDYSYEPNTSKD